MASSLAVLISLVACAALASGVAGVRVELARAHSSRLVGDALRRDMHRHSARRLATSGDTVSAPTMKDPANLGEYLMSLAIGTPPRSYPAIADTGSDLIWTQCAPCSDQCFQQPTPLYNPASSTTFSPATCDTSPGNLCSYNYTYGLGWTAGILGLETFTFGGSSPANQARVPGIAFGCSNASSDNWSGSSGLVGLGRGSLSLVTQLGADKFSYCLTPFQDTNSTSTLLLGPSASLNGRGVGSTSFVTSPAQALTHYYVNLTGISLGATALSIPADAFALNDTDGTGGIIIDSGTTFTYMVDAAYQHVRAAVLSLVTTLPTTDASATTGLDLCFALPSSTSAPPAMPSMTLHFDGADMVLPADSYMILDAGLWCLAMQTNIPGLPSILGNYQQQNMHILYDVGQETLSFAPANCGTF
ncbi:hypothetical protein HU200_034391 [Digitaria exilis]|uniref:Peptidase A1 domain-containing protein n=1 Tax=Digitaria exilis TaxID=1010633 RepID=A0A835EM98_9POAL|nr:hypothetical protein HU200_034391 [Digitaria exilis]